MDDGGVRCLGVRSEASRTEATMRKISMTGDAQICLPFLIRRNPFSFSGFAC
jgi:hypothetical protein